MELRPAGVDIVVPTNGWPVDVPTRGGGRGMWEIRVILGRKAVMSMKTTCFSRFWCGLNKFMYGESCVSSGTSTRCR